MKKILLFLFILILYSFSFSITKADSLEQLLKTIPDEEQIKILNELTVEYSSSGNHAEVINISNQIIDIYTKSAEEDKIAPILMDLAQSHYKMGNYDNALMFNDQALELNRKYGIKNGEAQILSDIGYIYSKKSADVKAIEYYQKSLKISEEFNERELTASTLNRIGGIYRKLKNYEKALEYYLKSLEIREEINDLRGIAGSTNNIGNAYQHLNKLDEALEYYFRALSMNEQMGNIVWKGSNLNNIGKIYEFKGDYEKALEYHFQSLKIKEERNDRTDIVWTLGNIATAYHVLGNTKKAIEYSKQSLLLAKEIGLKQRIAQNYLNLADMHTTLKNYKTALEYKNLYTSLNDSIFNEEKFKTITDIQTKYETEKKEKEIDILTKNTQIQKLQLRNSRIIILSIILGFITVLMLASIIYKAYRKTKIEVEKRKAAEKELNELNRNLEQRVENEVKIRRGQEQKAIEQSRLASLGELAAGIAHEINQPLHSIAFSVDNMKMAIEEGDADGEYLQKKTKNIFSDVDRMKRIVDHIRTFSRKQTGEKKAPFSINQSIANAIDMIGEQYANHRIKLQTDLDENLPEILGNLYRFEQVVLILLSNGKDAVEEKALTADEGFRKELSLKTFQTESKIFLEFTDNGSGIPQENLEKIFNPFYTTKKSGEGTGLGLSIAFGIIGEMDGTISVESDVGIGTKMIIQFPTNILEV